MAEEASDVKIAMVALLNAELVAGRMRWIVQNAMDLEKMEKAVNVRNVRALEFILARNAAEKT